ncbi:hypothetical protein BDY24DRAFT_397175 [Mrakia frigida]|uniref:uncharacterized protein n=1 Tax=Mrakia frigida TaxID=29902 RepID=UPI003FCC13A9
MVQATGCGWWCWPVLRGMQISFQCQDEHQRRQSRSRSKKESTRRSKSKVEIRRVDGEQQRRLSSSSSFSAPTIPTTVISLLPSSSSTSVPFVVPISLSRSRVVCVLLHGSTSRSSSLSFLRLGTTKPPSLAERITPADGEDGSADDDAADETKRRRVQTRFSTSFERRAATCLSSLPFHQLANRTFELRTPARNGSSSSTPFSAS